MLANASAMSRRPLLALALACLVALPAALALSDAALAWGNGDGASAVYPDFGVHDMATDFALRDLQFFSLASISWATDWYLFNSSDWGPSFDPASTRPTATDNLVAYTDDPDSDHMDWDNHTHFLNRQTATSPSEGDAARRVADLYNQTTDALLAWMRNGSRKWDANEHRAAYLAGLMSHYLMDTTQFGHTDYTLLDHAHPADDPEGATYHSYYESRVWTDSALKLLDITLKNSQLPRPSRTTDPWRLVDDLARYVNSRDGTTVQLTDADSEVVTVGSDYAWALATFASNWDAFVTFNGARGYDQGLWDYTLANLVAGIENLTTLWFSAFHDARDEFRATAPDVYLEGCDVTPAEGAVDGDQVLVEAYILNKGASPTGNFSVALYVDSEWANSTTVGSLDADGWAVVPIGWTGVAGVHDLYVVADSLYEVVESNETNNVWAAGYIVGLERHASRFSKDPVSIFLSQDSTGGFLLILFNEGNRPDVYEISILPESDPFDLFVTILEDEIVLAAGARYTFHVDVTAPLDAPPGERSFTVIAKGGNSTATVELTVYITERQLPPFIVLEYGHFANVSVPHTFDASGSWDHNGDSITFTWDFGDGGTAFGPVVTHAYSAVGVYEGALNASDGKLHRVFIFEVSVIDAIPPASALAVLDVDMDAAVVSWTPWRSGHYFSEYRIFISTSSVADDVFSARNLSYTITRSYVDNATIRLVWGQTCYVGLVTVNALGLEVRSPVLAIVPALRVMGDPGPDLAKWVELTNLTKNGLDARWPAWERLRAPPYDGPRVDPPIAYGIQLSLFVLNRSADSAWEPWGGARRAGGDRRELDLRGPARLRRWHDSDGGRRLSARGRGHVRDRDGGGRPPARPAARAGPAPASLGEAGHRAHGHRQRHRPGRPRGGAQGRLGRRHPGDRARRGHWGAGDGDACLRRRGQLRRHRHGNRRRRRRRDHDLDGGGQRGRGGRRRRGSWVAPARGGGRGGRDPRPGPPCQAAWQAARARVRVAAAGAPEGRGLRPPTPPSDRRFTSRPG